MTTILVAAEAEWVRNQMRSAFVGPDQLYTTGKTPQGFDANQLQEALGRL